MTPAPAKRRQNRAARRGRESHVSWQSWIEHRNGRQLKPMTSSRSSHTWQYAECPGHPLPHWLAGIHIGGRSPLCHNGSVRDREEEISSALPKDLDALPQVSGFRLRGLEMTRLEGFVDATFAFAITVLII